MTIEFTYKQGKELYHVVAECYDASVEDFEVEVTDSSGVPVEPSNDMTAEARHRLIDMMPELEYNND